MTNWKTGLDPELFYLGYGTKDQVQILEDIQAIDPKGGHTILEKGRSFHAGMKGGFLFCRLGGNKYNEAAIAPADFSKVQIIRQSAISKRKTPP
ncbi:hypothetical protein [Methylobacterium sp. WL19]|uniref:hypothetical protein n=1 Tax=Methylobacterium sp. WL19 TaxID=2603896 RepID=UPI0011C987D8|nr:hypothetical protein [Methylobacterium sp. WL19]TXN27215.1 hypothetical protein FV220_12130 [Methylobacterium sp. WL19]